MKPHLKKTLIVNRVSVLRFFVLVAIVLLTLNLNAQIGINTLAPDTTAALDIYPKANSGGKMGILIPRLGETTRLSMTKAAKGLMVYDTTNLMFYVNLTSGIPTWFAINPWVTSATASAPNAMYTHSTVTNVGIGTNTPTVRLDVNGSIKSNSVIATNTLTTNTLSVTGFATSALVPTGLISMWNGAIAPAGWGLCDGSTYTTPGGTIVSPDLRGRFILSSGTNTAPAVGDLNPAYVVGQKGGENTHTLSAVESGLPVHSHISPPHGHGSANGVYSSGPGPTDVYAMGNAECCTNAVTPPFSSVSVTINNSVSQNASAAHENRPPYYVLAYIIKLP